MSIISLVLGAVWFMFHFITSAASNTPPTFFWAFADLSLPSTLGTCTTHPIQLVTTNTTTNVIGGVPPFYMISFPINGTPITDLIGSDPSNLSWQVTQPLNSQLLLSVVDSNGASGGTPAHLITVVAGQTTTCIKQTPDTHGFTVTANLTSDLQPCAPWGITIQGGSPPYNVTLTETNSPFVTNVTMPANDDRFTFINRATAGGQLFAAVSDFEGRWASGTPVIKVEGYTDIDCPGLTSSSGDATLIDAQDAALTNASKRRKATNTAVIVVVVLLILSIMGGAAFWFIRKRRQRLVNEEDASRVTQFAPVTLASQSEQGPIPGKWQVGSDVKRTQLRETIVPPYREVDRARAAASSTRRPPDPVEARPESSRPPLPRLQMPEPPSNMQEKPSSIGSNQIDRTSNTSQTSFSRAPASRFATFPVTSIRKDLAAGRTNPNAMARSASASAAAGLTDKPMGVGVRRSATNIANARSNPFAAPDEDNVLSDYMQYYQESAENTGAGESVSPPQYRSGNGRVGPRRMP